MIVKMQKAFVAVRGEDKDRLLKSLRRLGAVHLRPVDQAKAAPDERMVTEIQRLARAEQVLSNVVAAGEAPQMEALAAADRALELYGRAADVRTRLSVLHRQVEHLAPWGDVKLETFEALRRAGLFVRFFTVTEEDLEKIPGECVEVVGAEGKRKLVVAVFRDEAEPELPESVRPLALPERDRPSIVAEAKEMDRQTQADAEELTQLAHHLEAIVAERERLEEQTRYVAADRGGLVGEALFAVQGWVPADRADAVTAGLRDDGLDAGVEFVAPPEGEEPPTLLRYPRWARPIEGLFTVLGTTPGYKEFDVSGAFMIALPIFAAMLIADGGYGLLFLLPALMLYGKMCRKDGKPLTQLILIIGLVSVIWGVVTCSFFGVSGQQLQSAGGVWAGFYRLIDPILLYRGSLAEEGPRLLITRLVFVLGTIHMTFAQLWRAMAYWPNLKALSHVGWGIFLWGMLFVVLSLVVGAEFHPVAPWLLAGGGLLAILFASPNKNPLKMVGLGLANFPLTAVGTLSDTISYIRLMAVGLASAILASTFNDMAADVAQAATWAVGGLVLIAGHGLNIGLAIIALFAHGVRLNMLEFSNSLGMEWSGYAYDPFAARQAQET